MKWALWIMLNPSTADSFDDDQTATNIIHRTTLWAGIATPADTKKSAIISACGRYRYELRRQWPIAEPDMQMPVRIPGCMGLIVGNLYAYRATNPMDLVPLSVEEAIGEDCDEHLRSQIEEAELVMCAWGNGPWSLRQSKHHTERAAAVCAMIRAAGKTPFMLDRTKSGMPRHPLYWPADAVPVEYAP